MSIRGKKIVLTGTFTEIERKDAHAKLEAMGADVTSAVSGKTQMLFAGKRGGSKLAKAQAAGIPVYGEAELLKVLETGEAPASAGSAKPKAKPVTAKPEAADLTSPMPSFPIFPDEGRYEKISEAGVVVERGQFSGGKRSGTWTWFHENGARQCEGAYIEGKQQGLETHWYDSGEFECSGDFLDDERHGYWEWKFKTGEKKGSYTYARGKKEGPYQWWHTPTTRHSVGAFHDDKHSGEWTWFGDDGEVDTKRGYDEKGYKHGPELTHHDNGTLKQRCAYSHAALEGLRESFYEDGKPEERANYLRGEYHGLVETWDEEGHKTSVEYLHGLPAELPAKKLAAIAKKIKKKKDSYDKLDCLDDIADYSTREALLVRMHVEGHLNLSSEPLLWDELDIEAVDGKALADILAGVESYKVGKDHSINMLCGFWPEALDALCVQVYARDPGPLDDAWMSFPEPVRRGFSLVLRRFGKLDAADLEGDVLDDLAKFHVKEYGLPHSIWMPVAGGESGDRIEVDEVAIYGELQVPNERFYEFVELFGPRKRWDKALLKYAAKHGGNFGQVKDAFRLATAKQVVKLFDKLSPGTASAFTCLRELREDEPADLLALADALDGDQEKEVAVICAVLRFAQRDEAIPDGVDARIGFRGYETSVSTPLFVGLPETIEALQALGTVRAHAILDRELQGKYFKTYPIPLLGVFDDAALRERAYGVIEQAAEEKYYNMQFVSHALAYWGRDALPVLATKCAAAKPKPLRDTYRRAIVIALADLAGAGETWPEAYDEHIEFYDWGRSIDDHQYEHYVGPVLRKAIKGLPIDRARAVMARALDPQHKKFARALACLPDLKDTEIWQAGFKLLHGHAHEVKGGTKYELIGGWREIGEDADDWFRWCVLNDPSPKLVALLKELDHNLDEKMKKWVEAAGDDAKVPEALDKVDELVAQIQNYVGDGERERIYLLKKVDERPDESLNQIGGCPLGVTADSWPLYDGEPMEHLFTLDLDTMPESRGPTSKTRAAALFISNAGSNEAYSPDNEHTELVIITAEDLAKGRLESAPGQPRELGYFVPMAADVPSAVFSDEPPEDPELNELRGAIYSASARALGQPLWLQDSEHWGFLLMQFDEGFVDINLGDAGVMYLFSDTAFWQCH